MRGMFASLNCLLIGLSIEILMKMKNIQIEYIKCKIDNGENVNTLFSLI